jgi:hypothetical protein
MKFNGKIYLNILFFRLFKDWQVYSSKYPEIVPTLTFLKPNPFS